VGPILDTVVVSHAVVGASCEESERRVNMGLLHPFTVRVRTYYFSSSVVRPQGYKVGGHPCPHLCPLAQTPIASFPASEKRERERETREHFWGLESVASSPLSNYGKVGLDSFRDHTGPPAGPREPRVHDADRARDLSCA
jgi:hypothetical protein